MFFHQWETFYMNKNCINFHWMTIKQTENHLQCIRKAMQKVWNFNNIDCKSTTFPLNSWALSIKKYCPNKNLFTIKFVMSVKACFVILFIGNFLNVSLGCWWLGNGKGLFRTARISERRAATGKVDFRSK